MKLKLKIGCLGILFLTFLNGPVVLADSPAFPSGGYRTNQPPSFTGTKGWSFVNYGSGSSDNSLAITQLGVFDTLGDGLANAHAIGIWSANGTLLASTTIPAGTVASLVDGYRYMPITPVLIEPLIFTNYSTAITLIAAEYLAGDADDLVTPNGIYGGPGFAPPVHLISYDGSPSFGYYGLGSGLPFPGQHFPPPEGGGNPPFWEVNFQFNVVQVPEPSMSLLLAPGLLYLLLRRRLSPPNKPV